MSTVRMSGLNRQNTNALAKSMLSGLSFFQLHAERYIDTQNIQALRAGTLSHRSKRKIMTHKVTNTLLIIKGAFQMRMMTNAISTLILYQLTAIM